MAVVHFDRSLVCYLTLPLCVLSLVLLLIINNANVLELLTDGRVVQWMGNSWKIAVHNSVEIE